MGTFLFIAGGLLAGGIASVIARSISGVFAAIAYALALPLGSRSSIFLGAAAAAPVGVLWVGLVFRAAGYFEERGFAEGWAVWGTAFFISLFPITLALRGPDGQSSLEQLDLGQALRIAGFVHLCVAVATLASDTIYRSWDWLPF